MAKSGIGFHILYEQLDNNAAKNKLIGHIQKINPRWINLMGGARRDQAFLFARQLKEQFKTLKIIFRNWPDDANNVKSEYANNPQLWVDHNSPYLAAGLTVLTDNESVTDDMHHYSDWSAAIMDICGKHGWSVAVGRFAVGNVQGFGGDKNSQYVHLDSMWRGLAKWGSLHTWSPNEYFDPTGELSGGMAGRYVAGLARSRKLGLPDPVITIGEYGVVYRYPNGQVDAGGGYRDSRCNLDGYRAARLSIDMWRKHYRDNGVDVSLYCYGDSIGNRWSPFRIDGDDAFMNELVRAAQAGELEPVTKVNAPPVVVVPPVVTPPVTPAPQKPVTVAGQKYRLAVPIEFVNVRANAGSTYAVKGAVWGNEIVKAVEEKKDNAGVIWVHIVTFADLDGWISTQSGKVTFTKV